MLVVVLGIGGALNLPPNSAAYPFVYTWLSFHVGCGPVERGCLESAPIQAESGHGFKIQDPTKSFSFES